MAEPLSTKIPVAPPSDVTTQWRVPLAILVLGMFLSVLDVSIVNVAIPSIQNDFGVSTEDVQWISTAYSLTLGVVVPASAWLGDRYGLARVYITSLFLFAIASALCGLATNLETLVLCRIFQAIPGGLLPVASMAMLYKIVPPDKIGAANGLYGMGIGFAPAVGPTLGGYIVHFLDWRLIFLVNIPLGVLGGILGLIALPKLTAQPCRSFDIPGFTCIAGGLFALLLAVSKGEDWGWTSYRILILITVSLGLLALFVITELEVDTPIIDLRILRHWPFANSLILIFVLSVGLYSMLFYVPIFLQAGQGLNAWETGKLLLPEAVVMAVACPLAGAVYDRYGPRWPAAVGLAVAAYGTYLLSGINADMTQREIVTWTCVRAVGNGIAMIAVMAGGVAVVSQGQVNTASALSNLSQRLAAAIGIAVLTAMATGRQAQLLSDRSALVQSSKSAGIAQADRLREHGSDGLMQFWGRMHVQVQAQVYSDIFCLTAVVAAVGAVFALFLKVRGTSSKNDDSIQTEITSQLITFEDALSGELPESISEYFPPINVEFVDPEVQFPLALCADGVVCAADPFCESQDQVLVEQVGVSGERISPVAGGDGYPVSHHTG